MDKVYLVVCDGYNHTQESYRYIYGVYRTQAVADKKCAELKAEEDAREVYDRSYDYNDYHVDEFTVED